MISETEKTIARRTALAKLLRLAYVLGREDERECPGEGCLRDFEADSEKLTGRESAANDAEAARVTEALKKLQEYENSGLEPSEIPTGLELANVFAALQELKQYKDAEEQALKGFVTDENNS